MDYRPVLYSQRLWPKAQVLDHDVRGQSVARGQGVLQVLQCCELKVVVGFGCWTFKGFFTLQDETRVNEKFENASRIGIPIEIKSVQTSFLIEHLANHGPIIMLTNASLLHCDLCKANKLSLELR